MRVGGCVGVCCGWGWDGWSAEDKGARLMCDSDDAIVGNAGAGWDAAGLSFNSTPSPFGQILPLLGGYVVSKGQGSL